MKCLPLVNIKESQEKYLEIIAQYRAVFHQKEIPLKEVVFMLEEVNCFWLERLMAIEYELEELTKKNSCFLLSGAIYLNISDYEHYYFKSLGDYHLLYDPFLKMENIFRVPERNINTKETIDYIKEVYDDTVNILTDYRNHFFILPIRVMAIKDETDHRTLLDNFFLRFLSRVFNRDLASQEEFCNTYHSFEEIEKDMDSRVRDNFIFSDMKDIGISLREKIKCYRETQMNFEALIIGKSESQIFLFSIYTWISQVIEILLICMRLGVCPYIRFECTIYYLWMLMYTFIDDKYFKEMIEKTIVFYFLRKTISRERFENIKFDDFCRLIENKSLLDLIIREMHENGIDIYEGGIKQVQLIIIKKFDGIM
jgi:hypothetical protein